jgi:plasmid stability protein
MRTTLNLDDDLVARAKALAARRGRALTSLMEDALRAVLEREGRPAKSSAVELPVGSGRLRPGVSLNDNVSLRDLMDDLG